MPCVCVGVFSHPPQPSFFFSLRWCDVKKKTSGLASSLCGCDENKKSCVSFGSVRCRGRRVSAVRCRGRRVSAVLKSPSQPTSEVCGWRWQRLAAACDVFRPVCRPAHELWPSISTLRTRVHRPIEAVHSTSASHCHQPSQFDLCLSQPSIPLSPLPLPSARPPYRNHSTRRRKKKTVSVWLKWSGVERSQRRGVVLQTCTTNTQWRLLLIPSPPNSPADGFFWGEGGEADEFA
jgi:hypothetical protein